MKKKVVVLFLSVCLAGGNIALPVHAANDDTVKQEVQAEEVSESLEEQPALLNSGTYGNFAYSDYGFGTSPYRTISKYSGSEKSVAIPASINGVPVKGIDSAAFKGNSTLQTVSIPASIKTIGTQAFSGCSSLTTVYLSEGLETLNGGAFYGCSLLKSITIPSTVKNIEGGSFYGGVFENCVSLSSVKIQGTKIGSSMFEGCSKLESVTIPSSVTDIGAEAFKNCGSLKSANIQATGKIGDNAFEGCPRLATVTLKNVKQIGMYSFKNCPIAKIDIPATVVTVGEYAFQNCKKLSSVTLRNGLQTLSKGAFYGCTAMKSVTLPASLLTIGNGAFQNTGLTSVTVPQNVNTISNYAFANCSNLKSATFYNSGTIGGNVFNDCPVLTTVNMANSKITSLASYAFYRTNIKEFKAPKTLSNIYEYAFSESKVQKVVLNDGLIKIGDGAFKNCKSLVSVNIPYTVTTCGNNNYSNGCFSGCSKLTDVAIDNSIIGYSMFYNCTALKSVVIPDSVHTINSYAFEGCTSLKYATFLGDAPATVGTRIFNNTASNFTICYFAKTTGWKSTWNGYKTKKVTKVPGDAQTVFTDVTPDDWFADAVKYVYSKGYMNGVKLNEFGPTQPLTRAMFVTVLYNKAKTEGAKAVAYKKTFTDVPNGKWYTEAALWAAQNKITNGIGNKKFGTDTLVTREQMASMLYSYAQWKKLSTKADNNALKSFSDGNKVNQWALAGMKWAVTNKIINGKGSGKSAKLDPQGKASRGECAQIIMNLEKKLQKK